MKFSDLSRYSLCLSIGIAMLAGCGGSLPTLRPVTEMQADEASSPRRLAPNYSMLFSFDGHDGASPAGLLDLRETLYGTTSQGGTGKENKGTVFSITTAGKEQLLYSFEGASNGDHPNNGLLAVNGTLYGTTYYGGDREGYCSFLATLRNASRRSAENYMPDAGPGGCGTVFSVTTTGKERVLYRFAGGDDGNRPTAGLIDVNGTLYGTTDFGGKHGDGTVFSVTTAGEERVLYNFGDKPYDGIEASRLLDVNGTLYGTTFSGGTGKYCFGTGGCGTVFSVTTAGKERVLYNFGVNSGDGTEPVAALIDVGGTLYGTTELGGKYYAICSSTLVCGTVFSMTTTGKERVLYSFHGSPDGADPDLSGLTNVRGTLYGTTAFGGQNGDGTVFSVTAAGKEQVLYSFSGMPDGATPYTGVVNVSNRLYGTTGGGGSHNAGTVFSLKP